MNELGHDCTQLFQVVGCELDGSSSASLVVLNFECLRECYEIKGQMVLIDEARRVLLVQIKFFFIRFEPLVFMNSWEPGPVCLADNPIYLLDQNFEFWLRHKSQDVGLVDHPVELYRPQEVFVFFLETELGCMGLCVIESKVH